MVTSRMRRAEPAPRVVLGCGHRLAIVPAGTIVVLRSGDEPANLDFSRDIRIDHLDGLEPIDLSEAWIRSVFELNRSNE